jgi:hypothetical protein
MALLSQAMRAEAFTGSTDSLFTRIAGRQGARWTARTVGAAYGRAPAPPADSVATLRDLHDRGVLTDAEFEQLRARLAHQ